MTLSAQKYANTFRTISGLINIVYDNDVILLCDTSLGAVNVDLAEIPADSWNTVYKLYVIDKSNNAGINNITIKAPLGYTVNNASTFVVNVNGGSAIVRITSNTSYIAETNYGFPSGLAVQDEGIPITPSATIMNFVGAGVNATALGGLVTVDIAGTAVVSLTSAQLLTLISTSSVVPNTWYLISNANFTLDVPETVPILVQGVTSNAVSLSGSGIFLNADYQQIGNYSGVVGFVSNLGVWQTTLVPVIGNVVIWNNFHYLNTTGSNGATSPNLDAVNWTFLAKNSTNGYVQEIDDITYQPSINNIISRSDVRNNHVENNPITYPFTDEAFFFFQWGNNQVSSNTVIDESVFVCCNNTVIGTPALGILPNIIGNKVSQFSQINLPNNNGIVSHNIISNESSLTLVRINTNSISKNIVSQRSSLFINLNIGQIEENIVSSSSALRVINQNQGAISYNTISQQSFLNVTLNSVHIFSNDFTQQTSVTIVTNAGSLDNNTAKNNSVFSVEENTASILGNILVSSNFEVQVVNQGLIQQNNISSGSTLRVDTNTNNGRIVQNTITQESRILITLNDGGVGQSGRYQGNYLTQKSDLILGTVSFGEDVGSITSGQGSIVNVTNVNGEIGGLVLNATNISIGTLNSRFASLNITKGVYAVATHNQTFELGTFDYGVSTIKCEVDMSDPTVYNPATFTLTLTNSTGLGLCGEITLINGGGLTINKITNLNLYAPTTFYSGGGTITFDSVAVGVALPTELVSTLGATSFAIAFNATAQNFIVLRNSIFSSVRQIEQVNIYL